MRLNFKRITSLGLAVVMSLSMMACGSKSTSSNTSKKDDNSKEVLQKIMDAAKDTDSVEITSNFAIKMTSNNAEIVSASGYSKG